MFAPRAKISKWAALPVSLIAVWLLFPISLTAQGFEGVVKQRTITLEDDGLWGLMDRMGEDGLADKLFEIPIDELLRTAESGDAEVLDVTLYIKGTKIRGETGDAGPFDYFVTDANTGSMLMVSTSGKYYVQWTQDDMKKAMADMGFDPDAMAAGSEMQDRDVARPQIRDLGKTAEISGRRCAAYQIEHEDGVTRGWVAGDEGGLQKTVQALSKSLDSMSGDQGNTPSDDVAEDQLWERGLPLRIQTLIGSNEYGYRRYEVQDVVSLESKSLSADLFEAPAGFTQKSLQDLWQQGGSL